MPVFVELDVGEPVPLERKLRTAQNLEKCGALSVVGEHRAREEGQGSVRADLPCDEEGPVLQAGQEQPAGGGAAEPVFRSAPETTPPRPVVAPMCAFVLVAEHGKLRPRVVEEPALHVGIGSNLGAGKMFGRIAVRETEDGTLPARCPVAESIDRVSHSYRTGDDRKLAGLQRLCGGYASHLQWDTLHCVGSDPGARAPRGGRRSEATWSRWYVAPERR